MLSADVIQDNLYEDGKQFGINHSELHQLANVLPSELNPRKLSNKNKLQLVIDRKGSKSKVVAFKVREKNKTIMGYRANDDIFYNSQGISLEKSNFLYPIPKTARLSSGFNPKRKNPVSGKISPHNGVDFSMPLNTTIISVGNGIVADSGWNRTMGYYVEISHDNNVKTRYLHLNKIFVNNGETVKKGAKIALSGNTGRSSGPHLHYELVRNNKPIDPFSRITSTELTDRTEFFALVKRVDVYLD